MARTVAIRVDGAYAQVTGHEETELDDFLSILDPNRWFSPAFKERRWDGRVKFYRGASFPAGLVPHLIERYNEISVDVRVIEPDFEPVDLTRFDDTYLPGITLREDQVESVRAMMQVSRGILKSGTGSGKTEIATAVARLYWEERGWMTTIVVPKKGLLHQTAARLRKYYGSDLHVGVIGDSERDLGIVTVATAQTLQQYKPYWKHVTVQGRKQRREFAADPVVRELALTREVVILDEAHHSSSESWYEFCMFTKARVRLGMSGSPLKDSDLNDFRVIAATGKIIRDVSSAVLIESGACAKPKIAVISSDNASGPKLPTELVEYKTVTGKMKTKRVPMPYKTAYKVGCVENEYHNTAVVRATSWLVDHGKRTLVLCRMKDHWNRLHDMLEAEGIDHLSVWGATAMAERDRAKRLLDQGKLKCILASTIFDEGEDVPGIDAMVLAEGVEVNTNAIQRVGRGMRRKAGDNDVWIVDFALSNHRDLKAHAVSRVTAWETAGYEVLPIFEWPDMANKDYETETLLPFQNWDALYAAFAAG